MKRFISTAFLLLVALLARAGIWVPMSELSTPQELEALGIEITASVDPLDNDRIQIEISAGTSAKTRHFNSMDITVYSEVVPTVTTRDGKKQLVPAGVVTSGEPFQFENARSKNPVEMRRRELTQQATMRLSMTREEMVCSIFSVRLSEHRLMFEYNLLMGDLLIQTDKPSPPKIENSTAAGDPPTPAP